VAAIVCPAKPCTQAGLGSMQYWHADPLGSAAAVSNAAGTVQERLAYEPFGKRRHSDGATDPQGTLIATSTARGFTGHEMLDAVGLIHMNGRVYDPALGRFLSADPGVPHRRTRRATTATATCATTR
jgi:RHS repeat-associated protein